MSWSEIYNDFNVSQSAPTTQTFTYDPLLDKSNPGIEYEGTESNAIYSETREIAGDFWIVSNAQFNGTNFIPQSLAVPVYATVYRSPASATMPGYTQRLYCAAGTNPVVWTTIFQIDNTGNIFMGQTLQTRQKGTVTAQLVDGSTNSITYTNQSGGFAFATATDQIFLSLNTLSDASALLGKEIIISKTAGGFSFVIPGGNSGDTATIDYLAYGH